MGNTRMNHGTTEESHPALRFEQRLRDRHRSGRVLVLDGGMGTTLWHALGKRLRSALWTARLLYDAPILIYEAHLAFAGAGSDLVTTATYQAHLDGFTRELGCLPAQSAAIMVSGIDVADRALQDYAAVAREHTERPLLSVSLCAYGATLCGGQEYSGHYPPPLGDGNRTVPSQSWPGENQEQVSERLLTSWHLSRIRLYTADDVRAGKIDVLAFETIPLLKEVRAVRAAVAQLEVETGRCWPFIVSVVLPAGRLAEGKCIEDMVAAQIAADPDHGVPEVTYAQPVGLAINCTATGRIPALIPGLSRGIRKLGKDGVPLILKPNKEYEKEEASRTDEEWVDLMLKIRKTVAADEAFGLLAIGGCCGTAPECIRLLTARLEP